MKKDEIALYIRPLSDNDGEERIIALDGRIEKQEIVRNTKPSMEGLYRFPSGSLRLHRPVSCLKGLGFKKQRLTPETEKKLWEECNALR